MKNNEKPNKILALRVRDLRREAHLSQAQLAEKASYSAKYISDMEATRRRISRDAADCLAPILGVDSDYLYDASVKYKNREEKFKALSGHSKHMQKQMFDAICALASFNGYTVDVQDYRDGKGKDIKGMFSKMRNTLTFSRNGKIIFSLSLEDTFNLGHTLSEIFMSIITMYWDRSVTIEFNHSDDDDE